MASKAREEKEMGLRKIYFEKSDITCILDSIKRPEDISNSIYYQRSIRMQ